jgi:flagellar biosynthesis/type III secretory pathway protein FliH
MKWSETITFSPALQEVQLLKQVPAQNWAVYLREREDAAYQSGRHDGEKALGQQLAQQRQEMADLVNGVVDSLKQTLPRLIQQTESELINLTLASAQKIVAGLPVEISLVESVVREALLQAETSADMNIQLHPEDLALLRTHDSPLLAPSPENGSLRFTASSEVTRGGCIVQTQFGLIDARREIKLEQLRKTLSE